MSTRCASVRSCSTGSCTPSIFEGSGEMPVSSSWKAIVMLARNSAVTSAHAEPMARPAMRDRAAIGAPGAPGRRRIIIVITSSSTAVGGIQTVCSASSCLGVPKAPKLRTTK